MKTSKQIMGAIIFLCTFVVFVCVHDSVHAVEPQLMPTTNDPIELAIQASGCNNDTNCVILNYSVQSLPAPSGSITAQFKMIIDDTGGHFDIFPSSARRRITRQAQSYARSFIHALCWAETQSDKTGVDAQIKILKTEDDQEKGESYQVLPVSHISTYDTDSYTLTLQASASCPKSEP